MEQAFIKSVNIIEVRHLKDLNICLADSEKKHLIFTGKNGSGKTSVLQSIVEYLKFVISKNYKTKSQIEEIIYSYQRQAEKCDDTDAGRLVKQEHIKNERYWQNMLKQYLSGTILDFTSLALLRERYLAGEFILAYYQDNRYFSVIDSEHIDKYSLKSVYEIGDTPSVDFAKYIVNLKVKQSFANNEGKTERANELKIWFDRFQEVLRDIYDEPNLKLEFDIEKFKFNILVEGREPFDFNTMSQGYSAVFSIICDLMMRMESKQRYDLEGIVLIDEIETHLHVELQKKIVPSLIKMFPNIQFILTTHSPFVLNSMQNSVVCDLEKKIIVTEGLTNLPYSGIVEGFFDTKETSQELEIKMNEYRELSAKKEKTVLDRIRIKELEIYLEEIPDFLALDIATEYQRLKSESIG